MIDELAHALRRAEARIALLEARLERTHRYGRVLEAADIDVSDPTKPRARIQIGVDKDGKPVKGPMVPYATVAGGRNQHSPPSAGQQFLHLAPDGNLEAGLLIPLGHSNLFPSPSSKADEYVDGTSDLDVRFKKGKHQVKAGKKTAHLITDKGQRIQVEDLSKLVIKIGEQAFNLSMDALQPAGDIEDF